MACCPCPGWHPRPGFEEAGGYEGRFTLLRQIDYPLPLPDGSFDVVSCMEPPLRELHRILLGQIRFEVVEIIAWWR